MLVQTFTLSGEENGKVFSAKAVDIYRLEENLIASKETFGTYIAKGRCQTTP
jgi:hypothetical protein